MSRDQRPGRANIFAGSRKDRRAVPDVTPPPVAAAAIAAAAPAAAAAAETVAVAPLRTGVFVVLFIAVCAVAGTGVAIIGKLVP